MWRSITVWGLANLLLGGCTTVRVVESEVRTYSTLGALPAQPTFRFDRLPSQQAQDPSQMEIERIAEGALGQVGLRRDDAQARYAVQLGVRVGRDDRVDWNEAWWYGSGMRGWRFGHRGYWPGPWAYTSSWYLREVSLALRDNSTGQVVYETHALEESTWSDSWNLLPAIFSAALTGFPAATPGQRPRTVAVPLP